MGYRGFSKVKGGSLAIRRARGTSAVKQAAITSTTALDIENHGEPVLPSCGDP